MDKTPVDFVVPGKPRVQGSKSKKRWMNEVRHSAPCSDDLLEGPLCLRIDYFFIGETDLDVDNMIKPIQDALKGCLYDDDRTIYEVHARKVNLNECDVDGAPDVLRSALDQSDEFVYVRVARRGREWSPFLWCTGGEGPLI